MLPKAYEHQAREDLRDRTLTAATGLVSLVSARTAAASETMAPLDGLEPWLQSQPDLESALVLTTDGTVIDRWPSDGPAWSDGGIPAGQVQEGRSFYVASVPAPLAGGELVHMLVRTSADDLVRDLENVRWLFSSIFLLGGAAFLVLAKYLTQTILEPLENIRRAAQNLADGEPLVNIPEDGDDEIVELGGFIRTLGNNRRHSRILNIPAWGAGTVGPKPDEPVKDEGPESPPDSDTKSELEPEAEPQSKSSLDRSGKDGPSRIGKRPMEDDRG